MQLKGFASLLVMAFHSAIACDCGEPQSLESRYGRADAVAIVRVQSATLDHDNVNGIGDVIEMLKGTPVATIPLKAGSPASDCWVPVDVGRRYLVFYFTEYRAAWFSPCEKPIPEQEVPEGILKKWRHPGA